MPFKTEGASVVQATYGYAMMATQLTGRKTSSVKLVALTHYSGYLSKLFRTINVVQNANCTSLSRNPYLEESLQDQLAVSLVCESRLRIVRFCLKPNIEVNLTDFAGRSTAEKTLSQGRLQFNEFTIELTGTNEYSSADG